MLKSKDEPRGFVDFEGTVPNTAARMQWIGKSPMMVYKVYENLYHCLRFLNLESPIAAMTIHVAETFGAPLEIKIFPVDVNYSNQYDSLREIRYCDTFTVNGMDWISPEALVSILQHVKPDRRFLLNSRSPQMLQIKSPSLPLCDVDYLEMVNGSASFITRSVLLNLHCVRIKLKYCHLLAPLDIVDFVHQWFYGNTKKLEYMAVYLRQPIPLTHGDFFNTAPVEWDQKRRGMFFNVTPQEYINCSQAWDIVRPDDKMLASFLIYPMSFHFIVWKPEYRFRQQPTGMELCFN